MGIKEELEDMAEHLEVVEVRGLDAFLMAMGFVCSGLNDEGVRRGLVHAMKERGLNPKHLVDMYKNLGTVIAEAGMSPSVH